MKRNSKFPVVVFSVSHTATSSSALARDALARDYASLLSSHRDDPHSPKCVRGQCEWPAICERCHSVKRGRRGLATNQKSPLDTAYYLTARHVKSRIEVRSYVSGDLTDRLAEFKSLKEQLRRAVARRRANARHVDHREGTTFGHVTIDRERYSVAELLADKVWKVRLASYDLGPIGPEPHVGVEIECGLSVDVPQLKGLVAREGLASKCTPTYDGSVGVAQRFAVELRVCDAQSRIRSTVERACALLAKHDATVNRTCGLHVHLDMRRRDWRKCYARLYRALPWLYSLVSDSRRRGSGSYESRSYCKRSGPRPVLTDRYYAINACSVARHKTLEVRLHQGTVDAEKISRWVELLVRVVDGPDMTRCPKTLYQLADKLKLSSGLVAWIAARAEYAAAEGLSLPAPTEVL